jgi:hypothetical protein
VSDSSNFVDLVRLIRSGNGDAAAELVRIYEPHILRVVRLRLTDPALRRAMDSEDICQSVLADFFVRAANGQFDLDSPENLIGLLATMARNKVLRKVDHEHALRRDVGRQAAAAADLLDLPAQTSTPSQVVMRQELVLEARARLTDEERYLADQRALGRNWTEIAVDLATTPDSARMRLARGLDRVSRELGLEELSDE